MSEKCRISCQNKFVKLVHLVGSLLDSCLQTCMTYTIAESTVNKLLTMDRGTLRNMLSFMPNASSWFCYKEIVPVYLLDNRRIVVRFPAEVRPSPSQRPGLIWCPPSLLLFNACRLSFRIRYSGRGMKLLTHPI